MKPKNKAKDIDYENVFCIRENHQWVAGIYHAGRTQEPTKDKKQEIALAKLANELFQKIDLKT